MEFISPLATYSVTATGLTVSDTGDFFQLRAPTNRRGVITEIRVFQDGNTKVAMNSIRIVRGSAGFSGGTPLTQYRDDVVAGASSLDAYSLPTGDVTTFDLDIRRGWNILQEFVWMPTPSYQIMIGKSDAVGIRLLNTPASSLNIGFNVTFEAYGG